MGLVGLCLAPLVLIIVGFVILFGNGVVMVLLLDLVKVRLLLSWMRSSFFFVILLGLGVPCLLALFPFVTALIVLLVGPLLGDCLLLVVLGIWLQPILQIGVRLFLQLLLGRFLGFAILVCVENEFDSTEKTPHTLQGLVFNVGHVCAKD